MTYKKPKVLEASFTCPYCNTLAKQDWRNRNWYLNSEQDSVLFASTCQHCNMHTLWVKDKMVYPMTGHAPHPNPEMPEAVKVIYNEAAAIFNRSPRAAAALLRLGIQILCKELGEPGRNINDDIASLVKKGLPDHVQQALDIIRVTGNEAVHPGQIDTDDPNTVSSLFELSNIIVEYMIAMPGRVAGIYDKLPSEKKDAIEKRDEKT